MFVGNRAFTNPAAEVQRRDHSLSQHCVMAETQDLALVPARKEVGEKVVFGFNVLVGGKVGPNVSFRWPRWDVQ